MTSSQSFPPGSVRARIDALFSSPAWRNASTGPASLSFAPVMSGSVLARVDAILASPASRGGISGLVAHSAADPVAAAMNRAARLSDADLAKYGSIEREVNRQLGLGAITTHAVGLIADAVSGPCADCMDAVSELGVRDDATPYLAEIYKLLFEMPQTPDSEEFFPSVPVWGENGVDQGSAVLAIDSMANRFGSPGSQGGIAGYMREEMDALLDMLSRSRYFGTDTPLVGLGSAQDVRIGDLVRIAFFVAAARRSGLETTHLDRARELAVEAIHAS